MNRDRDIYYIVNIKEIYRNQLAHTTIKKDFCGKYHHEAWGVVWFELYHSGAFVVIPEAWIEWIAPAEKLWGR